VHDFQSHRVALGRFILAFASIALVAGPSIVGAQTGGTVRGQVVATTSLAPIVNAAVALDTRGATTNDLGKFSFAIACHVEGF